MSNVQQALQENNLGHADLLIGKYFPKPGEEDLRGLEWRYLWKLCQGNEIFTLPFNGYPVNTVTFSPDGRLLALASFDNKITILDAATKRVLTRLNGYFTTIDSQALAFSPNGKLLAAADKGAVNLWRATDWQLSHRLEGESRAGNVLAMVFSPDGRTLASASNNKLTFWNVAAGSEMTSLQDPPPVSPGDHRLAYSADFKGISTKCGPWLFHPMARHSPPAAKTG